MKAENITIFSIKTQLIRIPLTPSLGNETDGWEGMRVELSNTSDPFPGYTTEPNNFTNDSISLMNTE